MKWFYFILSIFLISPEKIALMVSYYNRGDYEKCISLADEILKEEEANLNALKYAILSYTKINGCDSAKKYIDRWKKFYPEDASPFYYEGMCNFKEGLYSDAIQNFSRSSTAPFPLDEHSLFMKALAYLRIGEPEKSLSILSSLKNARDDYIRIKSKEVEEEIKGKRIYYRVFLETAFQYDSNVGLIPEDESLKALFTNYYGRGGDVRGAFFLQGEFYKKVMEWLYAGGKYRFYQNMHSGLHQLNFHVHRIEAGVMTRKPIRVNGGFGLFYSTAFISTALERFSESFGGEGFIRWSVKEGTVFEGNISLYREDFFETFSEAQDRDGMFFEVRVSGKRKLQRVFLRGGGIFRWNVTEGNDWESLATGCEAGLNWKIVRTITTLFNAKYLYRLFFNIDSVFGKRRIDHEVKLGWIIVYTPFQWMEVLVSYSFTKEMSRIEMYSYTRHVASTGLRFNVR